MLTASEAGRVPGLIAEGMLERAGDRLRVTPGARLLADGVIRDLLD
nr:hypothetical protein [Tessaracoccus coleopterorum]